MSDKTLALIRRRAERGVTWEPGSVPRNVSEAVADAFHDRRFLLDLLDSQPVLREALDVERQRAYAAILELRRAHGFGPTLGQSHTPCDLCRILDREYARLTEAGADR